MSDISIRVENLGKRYRIGAREKQANTLHESLQNLLASPFDYLRNTLQGPSEEEIIWALKDVSFEVRHGEVVGIIGRNGAGKSTLLKILSCITEPTEGRAEVYGRIGSLLEVGTGFHPELTGRENIYLNGAILGMSRADIKRKFDEIIDFSGVEKFIDTSVKRYSSGMCVRLAFAVAAHLDPEILLVDEVLAVGDAAFQKKCLGKMRDVTKEGRTVLFVSHNMGAVGNLCSRAILLDHGQVKLDGKSRQVVDEYIGEIAHVADVVPIAHRLDRIGDTRIRFVDFHLENSNGQIIPILRSGEDAWLVLSYECPDGLEKRNVVVSFGIRDGRGVYLIHHRTNFSNQNFCRISPEGQFVCRIPKMPLAPGEYSVSIFVGINEETCDLIEDAARLTVEVGDFFGTGHQGMPEICQVLVEGDWELRT